MDHWCFEESEPTPNIIAIGTYDPSNLSLRSENNLTGNLMWVGSTIISFLLSSIDMERGKFIELDTTDLFCLEYPYSRGGE